MPNSPGPISSFPPRKFPIKRLIAVGVTLLLLGILFYKVDRQALLRNLSQTDPVYFLLALLMFVPQLLVQAWRWQRMVGVFAPISLRESVSLILASNTMNLALPAKMGDLTKGYFLTRTGTLDLKRAMNIVIFEKMLDVACLALVMITGVAMLFSRGEATGVLARQAIFAAALGAVAVAGVAILYFVPTRYIPGWNALLTALAARPKLAKIHSLLQASHETISLLQSRGANRPLICAYSIAIWMFHMIQIYLFFLCLTPAMNQPAPLAQFISLVPLAIFIGLIPLTVAGFGARDMAIIRFFPLQGEAAMLGVSLYINLRYILPAIAGMPFLNRYLTMAKPADQQ
ncbi:MAG: flippase-like domain-containing protein [Candidatus Sumerlaeaceae bacterium]|nr:flippase-like domain-containing protein [Candidatus Sumerlaeaceae bacterium]